MIKAGVIGLGVIGSGVALCLARAGMLAAVYDVRKNAADELEGVPPVISSPRELAEKSDVVIIAVVSAEQTIDVLNGPDGVLAAARPDLNIVLVATVSLEALQKIRALTDAAGVGLVDCGVTGGQAARTNGLVCLVGATPERLAAVKPVLDGFAKSVAHMGGPNAGMAAKIARNVVVYGCLRAGYEGASLARAAGVDVRQLAQVIEDSSGGVGGPMMLMGRPGDPLTNPDEAKVREYVLGLMHKDLDAALDLGKALHIPLPLVELTQATGRETTGLK
ncbi:6-phosphogluconate dehydrogenase [Acidocella aquatica]|uniref:6-phosphogluconate dehydrogenase n=1 Tax=Acidocella aquatica TaxID=1922313 RepID=A0ABQ6A7G5_9PROT|nr:NAD(P)-dependent oxidoreductase [Acidocella aquatica]GLR68376.1 6-phosphogluconate dehydrogenase [Acidocella aquatica]